MGCFQSRFCIGGPGACIAGFMSWAKATQSRRSASATTANHLSNTENKKHELKIFVWDKPPNDPIDVKAKGSRLIFGPELSTRFGDPQTPPGCPMEGFGSFIGSRSQEPLTSLLPTRLGRPASRGGRCPDGRAAMPGTKPGPWCRPENPQRVVLQI